MENFDELEGKLTQLVERYSALMSRNKHLEAVITEKINEVEEANRKINELLHDREKVLTRVDALLDVLKEFDAAV